MNNETALARTTMIVSNLVSRYSFMRILNVDSSDESLYDYVKIYTGQLANLLAN